MLKTEHYRKQIAGFSLDRVVVGQKFDADMQRRVHRFKFVHNHVDRVYFASLWSTISQIDVDRPDIIVYPPISLIDRILRGKNHAKLLAGYLPFSDIPIFCPFLKRPFVRHQARSIRRDRKSITKAYSLNPRYVTSVEGKSVLLVDDLITTGWTAHTLSKLLKKAGAKEVRGWFLASGKTMED